MAGGQTVAGLALTLALVSGVVGDLGASDWGGISPGSSTIESVRGLYGAPSQQSHEKLEGYDTARWVYEGSKAPPGVRRLVIDFGLLTAAGYRPDVVRAFELDPRPAVFDRDTVVQGWGPPDRVGVEEGRRLLFYKAGLVVYLDPTGEDVVEMDFTLPQPEPPPTRK